MCLPRWSVCLSAYEVYNLSFSSHVDWDDVRIHWWNFRQRWGRRGNRGAHEPGGTLCHSVSSLSLSSFSPLTSTFVWLIYRFWMRLAWTLHHRLVPLRANTPHEFPRKIGFYFQQCYQVSDPGTCFQQLSSAPKGRIGSKKVENVVPRYVLHEFCWENKKFY